MNHIYGLYDPRTNELRYVGACKGMEKRLRAHMVYPNRVVYRKWIVDLVSLNLRPEIREIEKVTADNWQERERFWIRYHRESGARLVNVAQGGDGGPRMLGKKFSKEHRGNLSKSLMGHAVSEESKRKTIQTKRDKKLSAPKPPIIHCAGCGTATTRRRPGKCEPCYDKARRPLIGRTHLRQTHCKRGHAFDEGNVLMAGGSRHCRKCKNQRSKEQYDALRRAETNARRGQRAA